LGRDHRRLQQLGELDELRRGPGADSAAAGNDRRPLGVGQEPGGPFYLGTRAGGLDIVLGVDDIGGAAGRQRIGGNLELDGPGAPGLEVPEGLVNGFGNLLHARDSVVPLGDGVEDLELLFNLVQLAATLTE
jgi:hypothetical protein